MTRRMFARLAVFAGIGFLLKPEKKPKELYANIITLGTVERALGVPYFMQDGSIV